MSQQPTEGELEAQTKQASERSHRHSDYSPARGRRPDPRLSRVSEGRARSSFSPFRRSGRAASRSRGRSRGMSFSPLRRRHLEDEISRITEGMEHEERSAIINAARFGYGPLARIFYTEEDVLHRPFGGEMQPGIFKNVHKRKFANPAPMGLCGLALSAFVNSLISMRVLNLHDESIVLSSAFVYGGFLQILAAMWEMAVGNTFGATAFGAYGSYWVSYAIILTPGGFHIKDTLVATEGMAGYLNSMGLFNFGWFVFTFLMALCTVKSTLPFFFLFLVMDLNFLFAALSFVLNDGQRANEGLSITAGAFGILVSFTAWFNAYAGVADETNSFFLIPSWYFPWTPKSVRTDDSKVGHED
ncbi:Meiotically up-regulated protein 86 protein [Malassezia pachydermatis]